MSKKIWPNDAIMVIASLAGVEIRERMQAVVETHCRECGSYLHADSHTIGLAAAVAIGDGRPIRFFCIGCAMQHDPKSIQQLVDDRDHRLASKTPTN